MSRLDHMTRVEDEFTRLGTTIHPSFVLSIFVRQLPNGCSLVTQLLEGQDLNRDEISKRVKAR